MADYIYTNGRLVNTDELTHYGVPGMRWGVRRGNVSSAFAKSSKKLTRMHDRAEKLQKKNK